MYVCVCVCVSVCVFAELEVIVSIQTLSNQFGILSDPKFIGLGETFY